MIHPHAPPACRPGRQDNRPETEGLRQAEGKQPMTTMDLNSDLVRVLAPGAWAMTRRSCAWSPAPTWPAVFMRATLRHSGHGARAVAQGVTIGAHVAYPDLVGFGRRNMDVTSAELQADVMYQIGALQGWPRPLARGCATSSRTARSTTPSPTTSARPKPSSPPCGRWIPRWCWSPWPVPRWCSGRATRA